MGRQTILEQIAAGISCVQHVTMSYNKKLDC